MLSFIDPAIVQSMFMLSFIFLIVCDLFECDTKLCDKVYQWLVTGQWFSLGTPVSSTSKTDSHDITEIMLKVALNIIKPNQTIFLSEDQSVQVFYCSFCIYYCWRSIIIKRERFGILLSGLAMPHFCTCPNPVFSNVIFYGLFYVN